MKDEEENFGGLTRRDFLYLTGMGMAGMTLAAIPERGYGAEKKPKYGGRLRVGERFASTGLDAHKNLAYPIDYQGNCLMYGGLTEISRFPKAETYPMLAKSWEISSDGREYNFLLREGVKFHHGKEMDSSDVRYSIDRVMNPATRSPRAFAFKWVDSVSIVDKYHIQIRLKESYAPFLSSLTILNCPIIPAGSEPTGMKPAPGTGPFRFKSFVPNETLELTRFDQYWEVDENTGVRLPYLDSIFIKKIVDATVRWTALRANDLDLILIPPLNSAVEAKKVPVPGVVVVYPIASGNQWMFFNVNRPPFDHKKVRQAIAYAIDKNELVQAAQWGLGEPIDQPFLKGSRFHVPVKDRGVDLAKAKQLLAEAGYPNGFKTEFLETATYPYDIAACEYVIGKIKNIGIDAEMKVLDRAAWAKSLMNAEYAISIYGVGEKFEPDESYYMFLHSSEIGKNNYSSYNNKELDALLEKGRSAVKWEDRAPIYRKVIEIVSEDLPILYLAKTNIPIAFRDYVKGFDGGAGTLFAFYGGGLKKTWLDK